MSESQPYQWPGDPAVREKLDWWRDQKFGVIIHWGPYSQWGVFESWTLCQEPDPWCERPAAWADDPVGYRAAYERLPQTFAAPAFDPSAWAAACAGAGMKYVVFTTKHHDGFAMYDTALEEYKVTNTPLGRDVTREVLDAFREHGLAAGVYFSKADWHSPDYWRQDRLAPDRHADYDPSEQPERWQRFKQFTHAQISELLSGYGPIDVLWLDAGWVRAPREDLDMPALAAQARRLQPGILVVDREVHGPQEDYRTPEQQIPDLPQPYPWESCVTLGPMWYTAAPGEEYKPVREVVHMLCRIVARGGNLLLGLGPDHTGALPDAVLDRLAGIGAWLDAHGEAVYGTRPVAPYEADGWLFTARDNVTYAVGLLKEGEKLPESVRIPVSGQRPDVVRLVGADETVAWEWEDGEVVVRLPGTRAEHAFVVALVNES
ncbi:MAG: alpha-L-fucosidase [Catenulisporales bacterium]|nr:alpha-L-fucosidase [Catenulisporales bacterium]